MQFTKKELINFITEQKRVFDIVRLVDVSMTIQYDIDEDANFVPKEYQCYAVWNKNSRCENCISSKAYACKGRLSKFEFVENEVYFVMALYVEVESVPYTIEMVTKINDDTLFGAYGKDDFILTIQNYNKKMYIDTLTGAYNRRYFDEQLKQLENVDAMILLDVDHLKNINDNFGHSMGDLLLQNIVRIVRDNMQFIDAIIRWGGDEFVLLFHDTSHDKLAQSLEAIRYAVESLRFNDFPELKASVSMGCIYSNKAVHHFDEADKALYEAKKSRNAYVIKHLHSGD